MLYWQVTDIVHVKRLATLHGENVYLQYVIITIILLILKFNM